MEKLRRKEREEKTERSGCVNERKDGERGKHRTEGELGEVRGRESVNCKEVKLQSGGRCGDG